jgi:hypothetical protein
VASGADGKIFLALPDTGDQALQSGDQASKFRPLVVCSAFRGRKDGYGNLTVKKIPKAILTRCEWGKDDYSLKVENLPKAPPPKGQMELIPADGDQMKLSQTANESDARTEAR